jgi:hypothetical protein
MLERDHSATPLPLIDRFFGTLLRPQHALKKPCVAAVRSRSASSRSRRLSTWCPRRPAVSDEEAGRRSAERSLDEMYARVGAYSSGIDRWGDPLIAWRSACVCEGRKWRRKWRREWDRKMGGGCY